jgi:hypothetical protein
VVVPEQWVVARRIAVVEESIVAGIAAAEDT